MRHPAVDVDGLRLHERDDHEPAAVGERAHLEGDPGDAAVDGALRGTEHERGEHREPERGRAGREPPREQPLPAGADDQLQQAGAEQHEHHGGARDRGAEAARQRVRHPTPAGGAVAGAAPAVGQQLHAGMDGHRRHGRTGPRAGGEHPERRGRGEEQHGERHDGDEPREDEARRADQRAARAHRAPARSRSRAASTPARGSARWRRSHPRTGADRSSAPGRPRARATARCAPAGHRTR